MKYTARQLDDIAKEFRKEQKKKQKLKEFSKQEAVNFLFSEIVEFQKNGITLAKISEKLRNKGIDISTPTLKCYLQRAKAKHVSAADGTGTAPSPRLPAAAPTPALEAPEPKEQNRQDRQGKTEKEQPVDALPTLRTTFAPRPDTVDL
jgi:hypothetical protein